MKAFKLFSIAIIALVSLNSCFIDDEDDIYEEQWFVDDFTVSKNHWKLIGSPNEIGSYYEYVFDGIPLDVAYYDGIVTAYLYLNYHTQNEVQTPLPYIEYHSYEQAGKDIPYSVQYSYDVKSDGTIAFKAYVSDYLTYYFSPGTQTFKVAIIW